MPGAAFFARYTNRVTHVASLDNSFARKGVKKLEDWRDAGAEDCLYGAVLQSAKARSTKLLSVCR
jgi:hypothetical protein